ncbi:hypothetical protein MXAZACID_16699 [Acidocella sp. MX-AZ02]|nr:hypothetical protein [Acidocella sp. MX-AZ03]EKM98202.1 hypothetical protein MXAZACID_16699 [Acidocella sp. MX-AZ02]WBO61060.1 hypothetical protein GT370_10315 [Acidocella sp. MX-AZ03]
MFVMDKTISFHPTHGNAVDKRIDSTQGELECFLTALAVEMANKLDVDYVSASFFPNALHLTDGIHVGDSELLTGDICSSILKHSGAAHIKPLNRIVKYANDPVFSSFPFIKSVIGTTIIGRKKETVGMLCAFSSSVSHFSDKSTAVISHYALRAAATLEIINLAETMKSITTIRDASKALDQLIIHGYEEAANHVATAIYNSRNLPSSVTHMT